MLPKPHSPYLFGGWAQTLFVTHLERGYAENPDHLRLVLTCREAADPSDCRACSESVSYTKSSEWLLCQVEHVDRREEYSRDLLRHFQFA